MVYTVLEDLREAERMQIFEFGQFMLSVNGLFGVFCLGVDRCRDTDFLLLRHLSWSHDVTGKLQQVQIQLLQVGFDAPGREGGLVQGTGKVGT